MFDKKVAHWRLAVFPLSLFCMGMATAAATCNDNRKHRICFFFGQGSESLKKNVFLERALLLYWILLGMLYQKLEYSYTEASVGRLPLCF